MALLSDSLIGQHPIQQLDGRSDELCKMEGAYRQKEGGTRSEESGLFQARGPSLSPAKGRLPLQLIRKFQTDWLKIPLLREAEAAIQLVIKFQFGDVA